MDESGKDAMTLETGVRWNLSLHQSVPCYKESTTARFGLPGSILLPMVKYLTRLNTKVFLNLETALRRDSFSVKRRPDTIFMWL